MVDWAFLVAIGIILIILGFFLIVSGMMRSAKENASSVDRSIPHKEIKEEKIKGGGVILIGPLPIVFGTDKRYALILMILAIVLMLLAILFLE